jgi:Fur family ferric uptake transcriptional regulator
MKKHPDLAALLKSNGMRITAGRRLLLQFVLDHSSRRISLGEIHAHMDRQAVRVDRASIYRNLQTLKKLEIIQELRLPGVGKCFQYVLDRTVHHFYICKVCGKAKHGDRKLFERIERALKDIHGFAKANLSVVFYGTCAHCAEASGGPGRRRGRARRVGRA